MVGGGKDNNGRRDTERVSTSGLLENVQCALFLMINAPFVDREAFLHIQVNYKLSLMIKATFSKFWTTKSADIDGTMQKV